MKVEFVDYEPAPNELYTLIECPQCGFEGSREISVKDDEIIHLKLEIERLTEHQAERLTRITQEYQAVVSELRRGDILKTIKIAQDEGMLLECYDTFFCHVDGDELSDRLKARLGL
jgi:hypothetical protein